MGLMNSSVTLFFVRLADTLRQVIGGGTRAMDERVVCHFYALPSFVAVHGIIPAGNAGDLPGGGGHMRFQFLNKTQPAFGIRVAAVGEGMNQYIPKIVLMTSAQDRFEMVDVGMNPPSLTNPIRCSFCPFYGRVRSTEAEPGFAGTPGA